MATFLRDLAARLHARGYSETQLVLRMTRAEIGSFLGLKLETVSRTLSNFQRDSIIEVQGKDIHILDAEKLNALAASGSTPQCAAPATHEAEVIMHRFPAPHSAQQRATTTERALAAPACGRTRFLPLRTPRAAALVGVPQGAS